LELPVLSNKPPEEESPVGSYFVSNYPPYNFWSPGHVTEAQAALNRPPAPETNLGVYVHIPFCRKRCHFCYFKVYTDKDSGEIEAYLNTALRELALYASKPFIGGRKPKFIYFGGGTPSYLSTKQLTGLVEGMQKLLPWDEAQEIAFEGEPGTLTEPKLRVIRDLGVTRLSLGVEHFDDTILELNGRAHLSKEVYKTYEYARSIGFPQINIDLIAGMMGETEEGWRECVRKAIDLSPDSITIYQIEIPFNTTIFREMKASGKTIAPVATWEQKREWLRYAFAEMEKAGFTASSAYTAVKDPTKTKFLYRDMLWSGADMIPLGVASFGHIGGTHFQNLQDWEPYLASIEKGTLPLFRALTPTPDERLIREFILQLKLGKVERRYFQAKFNVDINMRFANPLASLHARGLLDVTPEKIQVHRDGLLMIDRLLWEFFLPEHNKQRPAA